MMLPTALLLATTAQSTPSTNEPVEALTAAAAVWGIAFRLTSQRHEKVKDPL